MPNSCRIYTPAQLSTVEWATKKPHIIVPMMWGFFSCDLASCDLAEPQEGSSPWLAW